MVEVTLTRLLISVGVLLTVLSFLVLKGIQKNARTQFFIKYLLPGSAAGILSFYITLQTLIQL